MKYDITIYEINMIIGLGAKMKANTLIILNSFLVVNSCIYAKNLVQRLRRGVSEGKGDL